MCPSPDPGPMEATKCLKLFYISYLETSWFILKGIWGGDSRCFYKCCKAIPSVLFFGVISIYIPGSCGRWLAWLHGGRGCARVGLAAELAARCSVGVETSSARQASPTRSRRFLPAEGGACRAGGRLPGGRCPGTDWLVGSSAHSAGAGDWPDSHRPPPPTPAASGLGVLF